WYGMTVSEGRRGQLFRLLVLIAGAYISLRYIAWRGMHTIHAAEVSVLVMALLLYIAEIYSTTIHLLGCIVSAAPLKRPLLKLADLPGNTILPSVDVMVPTYNEDPELLEVTLRAVLQLKYPQDKLRVYLLDDGGTDEKIAGGDPESAQQALLRRRTLTAMCERLGVDYITRPHNENAKAGNLNHALQYTDGELVAILDADHVPTVDFLDYTVPWMVKERDVFLVQTPHFMINPDPIDRNLLRSFRRMPAENEMFYQTIQSGLDFWSSTFFCGSAALLRRRHLEEVGGIGGDSITEDAETAFKLHNKGYRSVYVNRPMVAGLAPETFTSFVTQRMRWAQGMVQILLLKRPFMASGLKWYQKVGYMSSILFWLFPFARTVFVLAPLAYLIFGAHIYNASLAEIMAYTVPHLIATYMIAAMLFGRTRWPLISELYELMQSVFSLVAIVKVFVNPRKPSFLVTPKGDTLEKDFISPLSSPFYILFFLVVLGFIFGIERFVNDPETREMTTIVLLWNAFNFITVIAAFGVLYEQRQKRFSPRMPVNESGRLLSAQQDLDCEITDISSRGCRMFDKQSSRLTPGERVDVHSFSPALGRTIELPARVLTVDARNSGTEYGLQFLLENDHQMSQAVAFAYGDTERWEYFQMRRGRMRNFGSALRDVIGQFRPPILTHIYYVLNNAKERLVRIRFKGKVNA
ncbi:MAG: UDP-forming cellulose synthase catalytic subunit, partial [Pseudomonadota bacterium]